MVVFDKLLAKLNCNKTDYNFREITFLTEAMRKRNVEFPRRNFVEYSKFFLEK